jgi:drug/metabolite transporter (DMT)-like permease
MRSAVSMATEIMLQRVTGIVFALGAALSYATLDVLRKVLADRVDAVLLLAWMTLGPLPLFALWTGLDSAGAPQAGYWAPGLLSAALNVVANLCFLLSVRFAGLGATVPLLALTPVCSSLIAVPLLDEVPGILQVTGVILVVLGAFWLYRGTDLAESAEQARNRSVGMGLMVLVALCWSATTPLDRLALRAASPALHGLVLHAAIAVVMVAVLIRRRRLATLRSFGPFARVLALTVAVSAAGLTFQLLALEHLWAGLVETIKRGLGSGSALVVGAAFLGEPLTGARVLAVALTVAGVGLVLL